MFLFLYWGLLAFTLVEKDLSKLSKDKFDKFFQWEIQTRYLVLKKWKPNTCLTLKPKTCKNI